MFWDAFWAICLFYCFFVYLYGIGLFMGDSEDVKPDMSWAIYIGLPIVLPILLGLITAVRTEREEIIEPENETK